MSRVPDVRSLRRVAAVRHVRTVALLLAGAVPAGACGDEPSGPSSEVVEVVGAGPELQFAPPAGATPEPLRVQVRRASDHMPREDVEVSWMLVEGSGAVLERAVAATDSNGVASTRLTLGAALGRYVVRAELLDGRAGAVEFEAWAVDAPLVSSVPVGALVPGAAATLEGSNFSPVADHNVVRFGPVRARVLEASPGRLEVEVPACLPPRHVDLVVSLGTAASTPHEVEIAAGGAVEALPVGGHVELDGAAASACVRLPGEGRYLALARSAGTVAGARHPVGVAMIRGGGAVAADPRRSPVPEGSGALHSTSGAADDGGGRSGRAGAAHAAANRSGPTDVGAAWDARLRRLERELIRERRALPVAPSAAPAAAAVQAVPSAGQERTFQVLSGGSFEEVRSVVRHVGRHVVLYEDLETPAGALGADDFTLMASRFDDLVHPVVTGVFGEVSDLDGNERVVVLLTPVVNGLTPPGGDGFVGGFFYGLDLLGDRPGSNEGEVFYALVPDPDGLFGDPRSADLVAGALPGILAHELQHMIHFNERVLRLGAPSAEAVWLSEGLAQMAEDLVAREARARGDEDEARLFDAGNHERARRYLAAAPTTSLIMASGGGSLAERGAGWLFVRYLEEHYGGAAALGALTRTTRTSTDNVTALTGGAWADVLGAWGVALFDGSDPGLSDPLVADPRHRYPTLRPRDQLRRDGGSYPLEALQLGPSDAFLDFDARPAAPLHALIEPAGGGTVTLALGRADGGATSAAAGVYLRIVRLR